MNKIYFPLAVAVSAIIIFLLGLYFFNKRKAIEEAKIALDKDFSKKDYEDLKQDISKFINEIRFCRIIIEENILNKKKIENLEIGKITDLINSLTPVEIFLKGQNYYIKDKESFIFCHVHQFILRDFIGNSAKKNGEYNKNEKADLEKFIREIKANEEIIKIELSKLLQYTKQHLRNRIQ